MKHSIIIIIFIFLKINCYCQTDQLIRNGLFQNGDAGMPNAMSQINNCDYWQNIAITCDWYSVQPGYLTGKCPNQGGLETWNTIGSPLQAPPSGSTHYAGCGATENMQNSLSRKTYKNSKGKVVFSYSPRGEHTWTHQLNFILRKSETSGSLTLGNIQIQTESFPNNPATHVPCVWYTFESDWIDIDDEYDSFLIGGGSPNASGDLYGTDYIYIADVYFYNGRNCCPEYAIYENTNNLPALTHVDNYIIGNNITVQNGQNVTFKAGNYIKTDNFITQPGAIYNAIIEDCNSFSNPVGQPITILLAPNVMTPNGDGINDNLCFIVNNATRFEVEIYDSWGNLRYQGNGSINSNTACVWDGIDSNGQLVAQDVYFYIVKFYNCTHSFVQPGFVHVLDPQRSTQSDDSIPVFNENQLTRLNEDSLFEAFFNNQNIEADIQSFQNSSSLLDCSPNQLLEVKIFPNPTKSAARIEIINFKSPTTLELLDKSGKRILTHNASENNFLISLDELATGIYYLKVFNNEGQTIKAIIKN